MNSTSETEAMIRQQNRPFYMPIFKEFAGIQLADWCKYISDTFKDNKQSIDKKEIKHIISKINGIPKYIQNLSHHIYLTGKSKITTEDIDLAFNDVIALETKPDRTKFSQFTTFQKRVLMTLLKGDSIVVPSRYADKTMNALETILNKSGENYHFSNPYFEHYLKKHIARLNK